jgi:mannan endo-1,4-beta-mannosidase
MSTIYKYSLTGSLCLAFVLICTIACEAQTLNDPGHKNESWPIITRKGDQLMEGSSVFRFFGLCAPNIQQNESQIRVDRTNRFPDEYEIRDILDGLRRVGSRATRTFSLSVYSPDDKGMPVYISGRLKYNEEAFRCLDLVIAL